MSLLTGLLRVSVQLLQAAIGYVVRVQPLIATRLTDVRAADATAHEPVGEAVPLVPQIPRGSGGRALRVHHVDGVVPGEAVEVDPAAVAAGVAVDEPSGAGVVVAVRQAQEARLRVRVVAPLAPELL